MKAHVSSFVSAAAAVAVAASFASVDVDASPEQAPALGPSDFTIRRADLATAVSIVNRVVEKRHTIPILSNLRIIANAGTVMVIGTDLDIQITHIVESICGSGVMDITVNADVVGKMLRKSDAVELRFSHDGGDGAAVVTWGDFKMKLVTLPSTDFPMMGDLAFTHSFALPGGDLCDIFDGVKAAISKEETRYYLNGVFMHVPEYDDSSILFVATDGHRLNKAWLDRPEGADFLMGYRDSFSYNSGVIIPHKTVKMFLAIADGKSQPDTVNVDVGLAKMRLSFGDTEIVSKLIDGTFPDYQRVIPTGNDGAATADGDAILARLDVLSATIDARAAKLVFRPDGLTISMVDADGNSGSGPVDATYTLPGYETPELEIGFNANYLAAAIKDVSPGGGEVKFELASCGDPTIIRGTRRNLFTVVMPMRV